MENLLNQVQVNVIINGILSNQSVGDKVKQDQILTGKGRRISDMLILTHMAHNSQAHLYTFGLFIKVAECNDHISQVNTRGGW